MSQPHERLAEARADLYPSASAAAAILNIPVSTYIQYENGARGFARHTERFARFFRVNLEWLVTGRGEKRKRPTNLSIPIHGLVGAGANVELIENSASAEPPGEVSLPEAGTIAALVVRGDSQWPRFIEGEIVLYDPRPRQPDTLIGKYAVVQDLTGRVLIKILRRGSKLGTYRIESHNAPPEDNVSLLGAWKYIGTLSN